MFGFDFFFPFHGTSLASCSTAVFEGKNRIMYHTFLLVCGRSLVLETEEGPNIFQN